MHYVFSETVIIMEFNNKITSYLAIFVSYRILSMTKRL